MLTIENLTNHQRLLLYVLLVSPILSILVCATLAYFIDFMGNLIGMDDYYNNNSITNKNNTLSSKIPVNNYASKPVTRIDLTGSNTDNMFKGIRTYERDMPPRPTFFGRLDGVEVISHGEFEPNVLNHWEKIHWEQNEASIRASQPPARTKAPEVLEKFGIIEQNQDISFSKELFDDKNPKLAKPRAYKWAK